MSNYLYLDDEPKTTVNAYIRAVQTEVEGLGIAHLHPKPYDAQIKALVIASNSGELDGLILDLRLDQFYKDADPEKEKADYRAATLAQEIRTRATEDDIRAFPIVLWSTEPKLRKSYDADDTSHDLFDLKSVKVDIEDPKQARRIAKKLLALVTGYEKISRLRLLPSTLPFNYLGFDTEPIFLDSRIYVNLISLPRVLPTHEYSRFVIRELLENAGPLVNEWILAARLGIDLGENQEKSPGFSEVVEKLFSSATYSGPFSEGWPNWWFALIEQAWRELPNCPGSLRSTPAEIRVEFLKKVSGITTIVAATPELPSERSTFWTVCHATFRPIDPRDGYLIDKQPKYQWQDREYVSFSAILNKEIDSKKIRIDALEEERYKRTKSKL